MLPFFSLALAALYSPQGRNGFPSGKGNALLVSTVMPRPLNIVKLSIRVEKTHTNGDAEEELTLLSSGGLHARWKGVRCGTIAHSDLLAKLGLDLPSHEGHEFDCDTF